MSHASESDKEIVEWRAATAALSSKQWKLLLKDPSRNFPKKVISSLMDLNQCDNCYKYVRKSKIFSEVRSFDNLTQELCQECVRYCEKCEEHYAPDGEYLHAGCGVNMNMDRSNECDHYTIDSSECDKCNSHIQ